MSGRVATNQTPGRNAFCDDRACGNKCAGAYREARQNNCARSYRCSVLDDCLQKFIRTLSASGEHIVCEGRIRADKNVISHAQPIPKLNAAFDRHTVANYDVILNQNVRANVAVGANFCFGENYYELPDPCARAKIGGRDISETVNEDVLYLRDH